MSSNDTSRGKTITVDLKKLPKLYCVELPCFVKSPEVAVNMLGGQQAIVGVMQHMDNTALSLHFPNDHSPLGNALRITVSSQKPGVVVKMIRRRKKGSTEPFQTNFEVVGFVDKTWGADEPADYQFLPSSSNFEFYQNKRPDQLLEIVPQSFARQEFLSRPQLLHYDYDPYRQSKGKSNKTGEGDTDSAEDEEEDGENEETKKRNPDSGFTYSIKFSDPVPAHHPLGEFPPRWQPYCKTYRGFTIIHRLRKVFSLVPVFPRTKVLELLGIGRRQHLFLECMPYVAYSSANGPFLHLWTKLGFDSTQDPMTRFLQKVVMKFSTQIFDQISQKLINHIGKANCEGRMVDLDRMCLTDAPIGYAHLFINKGANARIPIFVFGSVLKHHFYPQICQLMDQSALEFVENLKILPQCNEQSGWYTPTGLDALRKFVPELVMKRVDQLIANNPVVRYEKMITYKEEVADQRLDAMEKFLQANSASEEEELRPLVDPMIFWLKKYRQGASRSPLASEDDFFRPHGIAQIPLTKSAIYSRTSTTTPVPPVVPPVAPQISSAKSTESNLGNISQSQELIATMNRIQDVYNVTAFNIFNDSDSEDSS